MIKLVILDVDGVLTDGRKYYDNSGLAVYKTFCDKDFTAIKKFKSAGCHVIFLSGDENINERVAANRGIPFYYTRGKCKSLFLPDLLKEYSARLEEVVFLGDDTFDRELMSRVYHKFCPSDAPREVKEVCQVLTNAGGCNCVLELYEVLLKQNNVKQYDMDIIYKIDNNEKF